MCEKFTLQHKTVQNCSYADRNTNNIWCIELDNNYLLKISEVFLTYQKLHTLTENLHNKQNKNRLAIIDYETIDLMSEFEVSEKPVDLYVKDKDLFILCAQDNIVEVLNTEDDVITDKLF